MNKYTFDCLIRIIIVIVVALLGSYITNKNISWLYSDNIQRSIYMPKGYIFGIVWTIIYIGFAYVWCKSLKIKDKTVDIIFMLSILLNFLWVVTFFGLQLIDLSRIIIILLSFVVLYQAYQQYKNKFRLGTVIMLIYLAWLIFATFLNFGTNYI
jgi:benzodiazapine receptor